VGLRLLIIDVTLSVAKSEKEKATVASLSVNGTPVFLYRKAIYLEIRKCRMWEEKWKYKSRIEWGNSSSKENRSLHQTSGQQSVHDLTRVCGLQRYQIPWRSGDDVVWR
jgi:hypothetical protein